MSLTDVVMLLIGLFAGYYFVNHWMVTGGQPA